MVHLTGHEPVEQPLAQADPKFASGVGFVASSVGGGGLIEAAESSGGRPGSTGGTVPDRVLERLRLLENERVVTGVERLIFASCLPLVIVMVLVLSVTALVLVLLVGGSAFGWVGGGTGVITVSGLVRAIYTISGARARRTLVTLRSLEPPSYPNASAAHARRAAFRTITDSTSSGADAHGLTA